MMPLAVVVLFTLRGIGDFVGNYYPSWVGRQVVKGLRHDVFAHYLRLPTAYLDRQQSGAPALQAHVTTSSTWRARPPAPRSRSISDTLTIVGLIVICST